MGTISREHQAIGVDRGDRTPRRDDRDWCGQLLERAVSLTMDGKRSPSFAASLTAEAVRRLHFGWLTLDSFGHVIECDERGQLLTRGTRARNLPCPR